MDPTGQLITFSMELKNITIGEWLAVEPSSNIEATVHILRADYGISIISSALH